VSDLALRTVYISRANSRVHLAAVGADRTGCGHWAGTPTHARPAEIPAWRYCKTCLAAFGGYANATREAVT
jgi:hypothetical protein